MAKYRKKPVVIEAIQYTGKKSEIANFVKNGAYKLYSDGVSIGIETLEGVMKVSVGDFVIKGVNGEYYPCKPDIFEKTYETVVELQ